MFDYCTKKRETEESLWTVLTSFGYIETDGELFDKGFKSDRNSVKFMSEDNTARARAEFTAICAECALACMMTEFEISVGDEDIYDLIVLFGFEDLVKLSGEKDEFKLKYGKRVFAEGSFGEENTAVFNIAEFAEIMQEKDEPESNLASLIYAEKNADGAAYEVAYTLRINGCIIESYNGTGSIEEAEKYAAEKGITSIIRVFADERVLIKDDVKGEIIETTVTDFVGFCDEEEDHCHDDGCDCGCHHEHEHYGN